MWSVMVGGGCLPVTPVSCSLFLPFRVPDCARPRLFPVPVPFPVLPSARSRLFPVPVPFQKTETSERTSLDLAVGRAARGARDALGGAAPDVCLFFTSMADEVHVPRSPEVMTSRSLSRARRSNRESSGEKRNEGRWFRNARARGGAALLVASVARPLRIDHHISRASVPGAAGRRAASAADSPRRRLRAARRRGDGVVRNIRTCHARRSKRMSDFWPLAEKDDASVTDYFVTA